MVKCSGCGKWQAIDFYDNVDTEKNRVVCARCRKGLDVALGEWVADYPDRTVRGYHVTRLIAPTADIEAIVLASEERTGYERQAFFNKDLGIPWAPEEGRLSRAVLAAAQSLGNFTMVDGYSGDNLVTMGVDVASTRGLHVRISEHLDNGIKRGIFIGRADDFGELERLMDRFRVAMAAIDHLPEGRLARAFAERFSGRVYLVAYNTAAQPRGADVLNVNPDMRFATVRRLEAIDAMTESIRAQRNLLPLDLPNEYVDHLQALVRLAERDALGNQRTTYRANGDDDYAQAEIYDLLARELWVYQQGLEATLQDMETYATLDDLVDFQGTNLADPAYDLYDPSAPPDYYSPGPAEPDFDDFPGF